MEPNKGQTTTRIVLLLFIWMTSTYPNIMLHDIIDHYFGKLVTIQNLSDIPKAKEATYFVTLQDINISEYNNYYFVNTYTSGKHKKSLNMNVYATKVSNTASHNEGIISHIYKNDYNNLSYSNKLFNKTIFRADTSFSALQIYKGDTLKIIRDIHSLKLLKESASLSNTNNKFNIFVSKVNDKVLNYHPKAIYIYVIGSLILHVILISILSTGVRYEKKNVS